MSFAPGHVANFVPCHIQVESFYVFAMRYACPGAFDFGVYVPFGKFTVVPGGKIEAVGSAASHTPNCCRPWLVPAFFCFFCAKSTWQ